MSEYTKQTLNKLWLDNSMFSEIVITTKDNIYKGDVVYIADDFITVEYYNTIKDDVREVDIYFDKIERVGFV